MSQAASRVAPRWSVAGHPAPEPIAALPAPSACVSVGPPLSARAPSRASASLSVGSVNPHDESSERLWLPPKAVTPPPHALRSVALWMIVLFSVTVEPPAGSRNRPSSVDARLLASVAFCVVSVPELM